MPFLLQNDDVSAAQKRFFSFYSIVLKQWKRCVVVVCGRDGNEQHGNDDDIIVSIDIFGVNINMDIHNFSVSLREEDSEGNGGAQYGPTSRLFCRPKG